VQSFSDAKNSDLKRFGIYYRRMRDCGIYLAPSQFEAFFVSSAHDTVAIEQTLDAAQAVFSAIAKEID
jgi:glutamate-1-semialdehyde 2,1-aminomutase